MIKKYIKKPVIIEAVQWTDDNISEIKDFCGGSLIFKGNNPSCIYINTFEGRYLCSPYDYIIKDNELGTFYPCEPDIFEQTYKLVDY